MSDLPIDNPDKKATYCYEKRRNRFLNFFIMGGEFVKVLLIYPEFPDTFWSFKHALKFIRKKAFLPPLGLLTIGPEFKCNGLEKAL